DHFVLAKVPYQKRPLRCEYRLTSKGQDLYPVVMAIVHWGDAHMADKKGPPLQHRHRRCGQLFSPLLACSERDIGRAPCTDRVWVAVVGRSVESIEQEGQRERAACRASGQRPEQARS